MPFEPSLILDQPCIWQSWLTCTWPSGVRRGPCCVVPCGDTRRTGICGSSGSECGVIGCDIACIGCSGFLEDRSGAVTRSCPKLPKMRRIGHWRHSRRVWQPLCQVWIGVLSGAAPSGCPLATQTVSVCYNLGAGATENSIRAPMGYECGDGA